MRNITFLNLDTALRKIVYVPRTPARAIVVGPVSYTHLDVYKRQELQITLFIGIQK